MGRAIFGECLARIDGDGSRVVINDGGAVGIVSNLAIEGAAAGSDVCVFIPFYERVIDGCEGDRVIGCAVATGGSEGEATESSEVSVPCFGADCGCCSQVDGQTVLEGRSTGRVECDVKSLG